MRNWLWLTETRVRVDRLAECAAAYKALCVGGRQLIRASKNARAAFEELETDKVKLAAKSLFENVVHHTYTPVCIAEGHGDVIGKALGCAHAFALECPTQEKLATALSEIRGICSDLGPESHFSDISVPLVPHWLAKEWSVDPTWPWRQAWKGMMRLMAPLQPWRLVWSKTLI